MKCSEVQERLTDYVARETGPLVADAIRVHLESCKDCRAIVRELTDTIEILLEDSRTPLPTPRRLSEKRRAHIQRAVRHPTLHWIESHHIAVSIFIAVVLVVLAAAAANYITRTQVPEEPEPDGTGVDIWIGLPPPMDPVGKTNSP